MIEEPHQKQGRAAAGSHDASGILPEAWGSRADTQRDAGHLT